MQQECPITGSYTTPFVFITSNSFRGGLCRLLRPQRPPLLGHRRSPLRLGADTEFGPGHQPCWRRYLCTPPTLLFLSHLAFMTNSPATEFMTKHTEDFLQTWDVRHCISSVSFPQSNGRAEVTVKTAKRLFMSSHTGSLDQDSFLRAFLQLRNTPDSDSDLSPAQIIFGRPLRTHSCLRIDWRSPLTLISGHYGVKRGQLKRTLYGHACPVPPRPWKPTHDCCTL